MKKSLLATALYVAIALAHFILFVDPNRYFDTLFPYVTRATYRAANYFLIFFFVLISFLCGIFMKKKVLDWRI
ncbi:MAG: hypothetical protein Q8873_08950 [Bacillota bacterium]|nr:hypothetical protein [Bacillota bacterium]